MLQAADLDADKVKADLRDRVHNVKDLLGRQVPQARQMLRKLLEDKIELEPVGKGRERGYKFRGALTVDRLIGGDAFVIAAFRVLAARNSQRSALTGRGAVRTCVTTSCLVIPCIERKSARSGPESCS
jgi:hypothetical protein